MTPRPFLEELPVYLGKSTSASKLTAKQLAAAGTMGDAASTVSLRGSPHPLHSTLAQGEA